MSAMLDYGVPCRMSDGEQVVVAVVARSPEDAVRIVALRVGSRNTVRDAASHRIPGHVEEIVGPAELLDDLYSQGGDR